MTCPKNSRPCSWWGGRRRLPTSSGWKWVDLRKYSSRHTVSTGLAFTLVFALTACARSPSFNVLGSYFPGWIACMVASILVTALVRFVLNRLQWERHVPALPLFYFAIALLIACLIWLIAFE